MSACLAGSLHRRSRCKKWRQPQADPAEPSRQNLDDGGRRRSLGGIQVHQPDLKKKKRNLCSLCTAHYPQTLDMNPLHIIRFGEERSVPHAAALVSL